MKIGLGTAQFGMPYGITNTAGRVETALARKILHRAADSGVGAIDTAAAYGESESVLGSLLWNGHPFRIISKLPPLPLLDTSHDVVKHINLAAEQSLRSLRQKKLYGFLLHRPADLYERHGQSVLACLESLKKKGLVEKTGVSVYSAPEIDLVLEQCVPDIVQLPVNALDQRLINSGHIARLAAMGVEIHARSIFLQGILLADPERLPNYFTPHLTALRHFQKVALTAGTTPLGLALNFVSSLPSIDTAIVGVTTLAELNEITTAARNPAADNPDWTGCRCDDENLLNPSLWPRETA